MSKTIALTNLDNILNNGKVIIRISLSFLKCEKSRNARTN